MKTYSAILFDWDGCLAQTLELWLAAYKEVFARYGLTPTDEVITSQVFGDWQGAATQGVADVEGFNRQMKEILTAKLATVALAEGAKPLLEHLHEAGKRVALLTTSTRSLVAPALDFHHIHHLFDFILTGDDVAQHKPHPESIEKALATFQVDKAAAIMIGDSKSDLGAAQNAQVDSALYYPSSHQLFYAREELLRYQPTYVLDTFSSLEKLLLPD